MKALSLRARLTIWYTFALLVALSLFAADVLWQQGRLGLRRVDREIDGVTATIGNVIRGELSEHANLVAAASEARNTVAAPGRAVAILDESGDALAARWSGLNLGPLPGAGSAPRVWTAETPGGSWRVHVQPQSYGDRKLAVVVASPLSDVLREQREVREAMWIGIPIVLILSAAGGLWLASVGLRPITDMAGRAARIPLTGMEDLGHTNRTDELGQLAGAFNGLVARLRAALQTQRQFMADASHELRTPVSVIRSAADVMLSREHRDEAEYREALTITGGQARRVGRLVEDMLVLARADAGGYPLRPVDLYLDDLVTECGRAVNVLATERGLSVSTGGPLTVPDIPFFGDEELLRQMLLNVLQNAVQHTPAGGTVSIAAAPNGASVAIDVKDTGTGIPEPDRQRIFDRFVQLDPARRGDGSGLGLPIARWIAEAHGGTLELVASSAAGSTFRFVLPLVKR